jgi:hypothetical protein
MGERASSLAVEDIGQDRKEGAQGTMPACYCEGGHGMEILGFLQPSAPRT